MDGAKRMSSNTICVSQEGPANALALNKDCSQVVIAGRNVFKVFSMENDEFQEVCNLRVGKNLNLNFSSIDVAWSSIQENTLATAATNGAVVVWNLGRSGRSKQEHVFSDHKRTVNKVSFHLTEPALLISGSQDGMMKCFDLRMKEVARTFLSNTESVRDVQFSPHAAYTFAAVSENGNVQLWDVRRAERCFHQFTAHSGPVFACDWHPEQPWLATASRDKTIKVWDIHGKPSLEHTIYTIASVGHVKWRPQKKYHIASCALVLDSSVNVWDVRRPHVPFATFAEHRDVTTAIGWKADPDVFLSTSRDCTLYRHTFRDAVHPVLWANPHGVCVSARGELALAASRHRHPSAATAHTERLLGLMGRKLPASGGLGWSQQAELETLFPQAAASQLTRWSDTDKSSPLLQCARRYRLRGASVHQLCAHNAEVARDAHRLTARRVWETAGCVYRLKAEARRGAAEEGDEGAGREVVGEGGDAPAPPPPHQPNPPDARPDNNLSYSNYIVDDEPELEEWPENHFHNSGVLGLPTQRIYIPPLTEHANSPEEEKCWVSAASAHYIDVEAVDWTLPQEAFPLRTAPPPLPPHHDTDVHAPHQGQAMSVMSSSPDARVFSDSTSGSSGSGGSLSSARHSDAAPPDYLRQESVTTVEDGPVGQLRVRGSLPASGDGEWDAAPLLASALKLHAELGDVQTPVCVMMVLGEHRSDLAPYIEEALQEHWLLGYLELLQRHKLWNLCTEIIRWSWMGSIRQLSQQSTTVHVACGRCGRRLPRVGHAPCDRCQAQPALCAVCHQVVRGLFAWCQGCAHGGHLQHMQDWMEKHKQCPAGCGHYYMADKAKPPPAPESPAARTPILADLLSRPPKEPPRPAATVPGSGGRFVPPAPHQRPDQSGAAVIMRADTSRARVGDMSTSAAGAAPQYRAQAHAGGGSGGCGGGGAAQRAPAHTPGCGGGASRRPPTQPSDEATVDSSSAPNLQPAHSSTSPARRH